MSLSSTSVTMCSYPNVGGLGDARGNAEAPRGVAQFEMPPPDWACEFLSPETRQVDTGDKQKIYVGERGELPVAPSTRAMRRLEAFQLREGRLEADCRAG